MRALLSTTLLLAACSSGPVRPDPAQPAARLENGLALDVERRPGLGAVTVELWLPAGTAWSDDGAAAVAARRLGATLQSSLHPLGGTAEAWAGLDHTVARMTVATEHLEAALRRLAGALHDDDAPLPALDPRPAPASIHALAWRGHAFARPVVGATPSRAAILDFATRFYRPVGAWLRLVGDTTPAAARASASLAFAGWTGAPAPTPALGDVEAGPRVEARRGSEGTLAFAFTLDDLDASEAARLDLLAAILSARGDARFDAYAPRGPALLTVEAPLPAGHRALSLALAARAPEAAELSAARAQALRHADAARGGALLRFGGVHAYAEAVRSTTAEQLAAFARAHLHRTALSVLVTAPDPDAARESLASLLGDGPRRTAPHAQLIRHVTAHPTVTVYARLAGGRAAEPPDAPGLAADVAAHLAGTSDGLRFHARAARHHIAVWTTTSPAAAERAVAALARRLKESVTTSSRELPRAHLEAWRDTYVRRAALVLVLVGAADAALEGVAAASFRGARTPAGPPKADHVVMIGSIRMTYRDLATRAGCEVAGAAAGATVEADAGVCRFAGPRGVAAPSPERIAEARTRALGRWAVRLADGGARARWVAELAVAGVDLGSGVAARWREALAGVEDGAVLALLATPSDRRHERR